MARNATKTADKTADSPISIRIPRALRERAERYAAGKGLGLATAIRTMVGEYLDEAEARVGLTRAEAWQREQTWAAARTVLGKAPPEASWEELQAIHASATARARRR